MLIPIRLRLLRNARALALSALVAAGCGPLPQVTYLRQERVLNDEMVAQVRTGMTRSQVTEVLGTPVRIGQDPLTRQEEWLWRSTRLAIYEMCFYVRFAADGLVDGTASAVESERSPDTFKPC